MPPKSKLDKFFAKKDKKKVGDKPDGAKQVDDDDEVMKKEAAVDFGIGGDFNTQARVIKLKKEEGSKETTVIETNEELNPQQQQEAAKGWREQDDVAKEAEEARKEREQKQQAEEEERKANPGVYRPGAGAARARGPAQEVDTGAEAFPDLADVAKYKSVEDYQKATNASKSTNAFKARGTPANAWSSQTTGSSNAWKPSGGGGGAPAGGPMSGLMAAANPDYRPPPEKSSGFGAQSSGFNNDGAGAASNAWR